MHEKTEVPQGTIILQEKPFVYTLISKYRAECCDFCLKKGSELLKCSNCKYSYYCGKICQKQGWSLHKEECKYLKLISPRILPDAARLLFRLSKVLQTGGDRIKSYYTEKNYRTWKDLMSHYSELKTDQKRLQHVECLYKVLQEFSQAEINHNFAEFMGLYGRMCVNSFNICNQELENLGIGIYLAASIVDHSCQPNTLALFEGTTLQIRTLEALPYLDWSKITICYIDLLASTQERQEELLQTYYFLCDCPKCFQSENILEMYGAACPNKECDNSIEIPNAVTDTIKIECNKCVTSLTKEFINEFKNVEKLTQTHLDNMKNISLDLDICNVCLRKQDGVLYKYHINHVKILDRAFESCIDLEAFDDALKYGLELIECYQKYYPEIHPLVGLLHLKLCKLLLYNNKTKQAINNLRKACDILKITHGTTSSLYKTQVLPLIYQCKSMLNMINGLK